MLWVAAAGRGKGSLFTGGLTTLQQIPQFKKSVLYLMLLPWLLLNIILQVLAKVMIEEMETQHKLHRQSINQ